EDAAILRRSAWLQVVGFEVRGAAVEVEEDDRGVLVLLCRGGAAREHAGKGDPAQRKGSQAQESPSRDRAGTDRSTDSPIPPPHRHFSSTALEQSTSGIGLYYALWRCPAQAILHPNPKCQ